MQFQKLRNNPKWENDFGKYKMSAVTGKDFDNLEVLLLEINPKNPEINITEPLIIKKYWEQWFEDMHIKYIPLHTTDEGMPVIKSVVDDFIRN